jgi:hypothetical protein
MRQPALKGGTLLLCHKARLAVLTAFFLKRWHQGLLLLPAGAAST